MLNVRRGPVVLRGGGVLAPSPHLAGGVVGVLGQFGVHAVQADGVGDVANGETSFI